MADKSRRIVRPALERGFRVETKASRLARLSAPEQSCRPTDARRRPRRPAMVPTFVGRVLMLGFAMAVLAGCASGQVTGQITQRGAPAGPLNMTWTSGIWGEGGKMSAVMPDGERFSGTYQVVTPGFSRATLGPGWNGEPMEATEETQGDIDDTFWGAARDPAFVERYQNKAVATLRGARRTTIIGRFHLDAGGAGMRGGGNGECQTSRGAKISAQF